MKDQMDKTDSVVLLIENTPVGPLLLTAGKRGIAKLCFCNLEDFSNLLSRQNLTIKEDGYEILQEAARQLDAYFRGARKRFDLPIDFSSESAFTKRVLNAVMKIPFGNVMSYAAVAEEITNPRSARAVGGALARNPIPVIIPCHRVVSSVGNLHGYSAPGGIGLKARLLKHEGLRVENNRVITNQ